MMLLQDGDEARLHDLKRVSFTKGEQHFQLDCLLTTPSPLLLPEMDVTRKRNLDSIGICKAASQQS